MPIVTMAKCDNCEKLAPLEEALHGVQGILQNTEPWFMVNIVKVFCTEECWLLKKGKNEKR